jgi:putative zinc finger/helix-turn-helix YgiT family protein
MKNSKLICRACKVGTLRESTRTREFHPNDKLVTVELLESKCDQCGATTTLGSQIEENIRRLAARKPQYEGQLMGEEYLALRKRYGLTQQNASKIFGKGKIAFSRYENEDSYPDITTRKLIELAIAQPAVLKKLADQEGVVVPLWAERCEDEQRIKVRPMPVTLSMAQVFHRGMQYTTPETANEPELGRISVQWGTPIKSRVSRMEAVNDAKQMAVSA